ncbi:hypothetical protein PHLGIDRAFT_122255 [Phlebiopsis gigantea 11061_1 CR5-6]|uniref:Cytosol aminopeptidase domain-containing protein n=1 Tax=Phlebiopsis gigantea (strain 11061_1 CR5-6) TaxID=745531 RepID=A0A0C3S3Y1_PHLG1|nr:hypothetical protein PHLGIDRAFT_122255 [Phlebiopsis gigantea 11061_1 CR5-6]
MGGRLVLANALYYACTKCKPTTAAVDVVPLIGATNIALGEVSAGVFTSPDTL